MEEQRGARRKSTERRNTPAQRSVLHYAASLPKGLPDMLPGWESRLDAKMTVERYVANDLALRAARVGPHVHGRAQKRTGRTMAANGHLVNKPPQIQPSSTTPLHTADVMAREMKCDHAFPVRVPSLSTYEFTNRATNGSATEATCTHQCGKLPLFAANGARNRHRLASHHTADTLDFNAHGQL